MNNIYVVLPAYNEEASIEPLFERLAELKSQNLNNFDLNVIVVDDGSTDKTIEKAKEISLKKGLNLILGEHKVNLGLGRGLETGFKLFLGNAKEKDILIVMDCDDTHPPDLINQMHNLISQDQCDIVIASRYQKGAEIHGLAKYREFLSLGASFLFRILSKIKNVKDFTCGYRAYSFSFVKTFCEKYDDEMFSEKGFTCMAELLLKARVLNPRIIEIPLILRYDRKQNESKMKILTTIFKTLKILFKYRN